ncbi:MULTISPECIES: hypothetical protein [unclassified Modicisalibacter]|uniref:hypothetical protein n=1 Tax=unclassified Modicisalibacter TaxID=2679913 RepID=UPI001CCB7558|nr:MULTISPECIES: hypothetical protein [unclassified Modicisalibacter]MBZ9560091.1 hypothetical protein [Modicisalibacter sp. R2A 31.J]MBZ9575999.1 hypothetical protein [Modicisalibacter sp. MOD 31.J]
MDRYSGKPFLLLLDHYVLACINQLSDTQEKMLEKMEPKLASIYNTSGGWLKIVSTQMDFPESMPDTIIDLWLQYLDQAKEQGVSVDPNEFAISFVNQNFPEILEAQ